MTTVTIPSSNKISVSFCDGARVDISGPQASARYLVRFFNADNGLLIYSAELTPGHFAAPFPKYFIRWRIVVEEDGRIIYDQTLDLAGKKVYIQMDSKALGDSIAWFPYAEEFRKKHQCEVHVGTFKKELFQGMYPKLTIRDPGVSFGEFDAAYLIGSFDNDYNKNKNNWRLIPLQQVATDCLGLPFREIRPKIALNSVWGNPPEVNGKKYVAIAEFSTFDAKEWRRPGGWKDVVEFLKGKGYEVVSVSKEQTHLDGVISKNDLPLPETINNIAHADFFIGVSSGLAWLAWALEVPTVIISGFTEAYSEMKGCYRVINQSVCTGCYNDRDLPFDRGNRKWCPRNKNMECSTSISSEMVKAAVNRLLQDQAVPKMEQTDLLSHRVLFLLPHCSTGGMPQYVYQQTKELVNAGVNVAVAEWRNVASEYVVQKNRIKNIAPFHTLDGELFRLQQLIEDFSPEVVHLQEFAETFLPFEVLNWLYRPDGPYKIVETTHGRETLAPTPEAKLYRPDAFVFAGGYHIKKFEWMEVPISVVEHRLPQRLRPDRSEALAKLGLDPEKKHILNVGLFTPGKSQGKIFQLARRFPGFSFHFVGNQADNFADYWRPLMADKPDNCIIWGERADTDLFYAAMDLFLFTSTDEFNPIVVKEALSWQMPVIMRNLETYCGAYDNNPLVTFFDNGTDMAALLKSFFRSSGLFDAYNFQFTGNWPKREQVVVSDNAIGGWMDDANREMLDALIKKHRIKSVIEVGSFLGLSAAWFAERVEKVICVDTWYEPASEGTGNNLVDSLGHFGIERDFYDKFVSNMKAAGVWDKITPVRGDSKQVADLVGEADLVYIDADHSREGCAGDIRLYLPKARKIICGDDYVERKEFGVIEAVSELFPMHQHRGPFWWDYAPKVAVIIPNKNYGKWLGRAILSVQAQTIPVEVVVVDGGSTDDSSIIAKGLGVRWMVEPRGRMAHAKNLGICSVSADFFVTLDADDWIEPTFIERCLEKMPGNQIVATQMRVGNTYFMPDPPFTPERFMDRNLIFTTSMFRWSLWHDLSGFDEDPACYEDWDFWLRAVLSKAKIGIVDEQLFHHTEHAESSCSRMTAEMDRQYRQKIREKGLALR